MRLRLGPVERAVSEVVPGGRHSRGVGAYAIITMDVLRVRHVRRRTATSHGGISVQRPLVHLEADAISGATHQIYFGQDRSDGAHRPRLSANIGGAWASPRRAGVFTDRFEPGRFRCLGRSLTRRWAIAANSFGWDVRRSVYRRGGASRVWGSRNRRFRRGRFTIPQKRPRCGSCLWATS